MSFEANLFESLAALGVTTIAGDGARGGHAGIVAFRLPSGAVVGWGCPDPDGQLQTQIGAALVRVVAEGTQRVVVIDADDTRTEAWKADQRAKVAADTAARFAVTREQADKEIAAFDAFVSRDAVAPEIPAADFASSLIDHECRAWLRSLDRDALTAMDWTDPKHSRLLLAVMRSPVPLSPWVDAPARNAWIENRAKADPKGARLHRQAAERITWLRGVVEQVSSVVDAMQPKTYKPVIQRAA